MQIVDLLRIYLSKRTREKIGLLLIVPFHDDPVATANHGFESFDHLVVRQNRTFHPGLYDLEQTSLFVPSACPRGSLPGHYRVTHSASPPTPVQARRLVGWNLTRCDSPMAHESAGHRDGAVAQ